MVIGWIAAGIALLSGALSYKAAKDAQRQAKKQQDAMAGVLVNKQSNIEPIPVIYGERRVGGTRVFVDASGEPKNKYLYIALVLCEGEVDDIYDIKIDDYSILDARYGAVERQDDLDQTFRIVYKDTTVGTEFGDVVYIEAYKGRDDQAASDILQDSTKWTASHKLNGVAYLGIRLRWKNDIFSGIPEITCTVKGKKIYDPRKDSTSSVYDATLGVSTHRFGTPSTYQWSDNPSLCIFDYLTNTRYGKGLSDSDINLPLFAAAADDCDDFTVTPYSGGSNTKIFRCNAVLDTGEELFRNVERMLLGCRGFLPYNAGKYGLIIDQAQLASIETFTPDNIIGGIAIQSIKKQEKFNRVLVKFANPSTEWQPDQAVWPDAGSATETSLLAEDGGDLFVDEVDLDTITDYYAARDFARILCLRSRQALRCSITVMSFGAEATVGDVVEITHPTPGWVNKPFQVEEVTLHYNGEVSLSLIEYDSDIYAYDPAQEEGTYEAPELPNPDSVLPPENLVVLPGATTLPDGSINSFFDVSFDASTDEFVESYRVSVTSLADNRTVVQIIEGTSTEFNNLIPLVSYSISVQAVNTAGFLSGAISTTQSAVGDAEPPDPPDDFTIQGNFKSIDLFWTNPDDEDLSYIEIKRNTSDNEAAATVIGRSAGTEYIDTFPNGSFTFYYWIRAVDTSGNVSDWVQSDPTNVTTILLGSGDFANGIINYEFFSDSFQNDYAAEKDKIIDLQQEVTVLESFLQPDSPNALEYDFTNSLEGFSAVNATLTAQATSLRYQPTTTPANLQTPTVSFDGGTGPIIKMRVKRITGTASITTTIYYSTASHGYSASYYKRVTQDTPFDEWVVLTFDMSTLNAGGSDWIDNTITKIRFDLDNDLSQFEIDFIVVGNLSSLDDYFLVNSSVVNSIQTTLGYDESNETYEVTASLVNSLQTTVNGHTTSINENIASINGVYAQYSVVIDNNDHVSGFGLISDIVDGNPTSLFIVAADQFAIGGTGAASDTYPFVVYPSGAVVNGVTIPAGAYMDSAFINYLSATKIETGVLNLANQSGMAVVQGKTSYTSTGTGFWLGNDSGTPKFNIGTSTKFLKFDGSALETKQIVIKDSLNRTVFDANEFDGTYIKDATVDTLSIAGNAVTIPEGDSGNVSVTLSTSYQKIGNSVRLSWTGGEQLSALVAICGIGTSGGSAAQTCELEIRRVYGTGSYNGQSIGQSFASGFGGAVVNGAYFAVANTTYSYIDVEIYARVNTGTKPVNNYFIAVMGSKR